MQREVGALPSECALIGGRRRDRVRVIVFGILYPRKAIRGIRSVIYYIVHYCISSPIQKL